jgi:hypothetical protein
VNCVFGGTTRPTTFVTRNAGYPGGRKGQKNTHGQNRQNRQNNAPTNADRHLLRFRVTRREKPVAQAANASPIVATTATSECVVHATAIIYNGENRPMGSARVPDEERRALNVSTVEWPLFRSSPDGRSTLVTVEGIERLHHFAPLERPIAAWAGSGAWAI